MRAASSRRRALVASPRRDPPGSSHRGAAARNPSCALGPPRLRPASTRDSRNFSGLLLCTGLPPLLAVNGLTLAPQPTRSRQPSPGVTTTETFLIITIAKLSRPPRQMGLRILSAHPERAAIELPASFAAIERVSVSVLSMQN